MVSCVCSTTRTCCVCVCRKVGPDRLEHSDQLLAEDIAKFSEAFAFIYSNSLKPVVDFFIYTVQMGRVLGPEAPFVLMCWFYIAASVSRLVAPQFGKLAQISQVTPRLRIRFS